MAGEFEEFFTQLFFGTGHIIGILILIAISVLLVLKSKYSAVLVFPLTILMGLEYLSNELFYDAVIIWSCGLFSLLYLIGELK